MQSEKVLVTGKSGTGKTTYFSRFLLNVQYDFKFLFDHQGEFSHAFGIPPALTGEDIMRQLEEGGFVVFDPSHEFPGETYEAFTFFADYVFDFSTRVGGKKLFACDEFQLFSNTSEFSWELAKLIENGRRYGIDCIFISQQLNLIHNRGRNQLTEVVSFNATDSRALGVLEELGFDPEEISRLPRFRFVLRNLTSGKEQRGSVSPMSINKTQETREEPETPEIDDGTELAEEIEHE